MPRSRRNGSAGTAKGADMKLRKSRAGHLLLLIPFGAMLSVPFYNHALPELAGIPFFYWYQLLWIPAGALLIFVVYWSDRNKASRAE